MTLDEAVAILKAPGPDMAEWSAAGAYVVSFYNQRRDLLTPVDPKRYFTTDADHPTMPFEESKMPTRRKTVLEMSDAEFDAKLMQIFPNYRPTRDAEMGPDWAAAREDAESSAGRHDMGSDPDPLNNGGTLEATLDGELGEWYIAKTDDGRVGLFRHSSASNVIKGVTVGTTDFQKFARSSEQRQQTAMKSIAQQQREFWAKQQQGGEVTHDQQPKPGGIGAKLQAFWSKNAA